MATRFFKSWRDVNPAEWRWPNFKPQELASKSDGELAVNEDAMDKLQALRTKLGKPMVLNSAYRSAKHNKKVGGAKNSMHLQGRAFDVSMANHDPAKFETAARAVGFTGFGYYPSQRFMHIDTGPKRVWGTPFKPRVETARATPDFGPEPKVTTTIGGVLAKPEVLTGAGTALAGATAVVGDSAVLQWAIAAVIVIALVGYIVFKIVNRPPDV